MNRHSALLILPVTHDVKPCRHGSRLETPQAVHYNLQVSNARISGPFVLAIVCAPLLVIGACEKKTKPNDTAAVTALDKAGSVPRGRGSPRAKKRRSQTNPPRSLPSTTPAPPPPRRRRPTARRCRASTS